nr:MAG TPA: hypothetical protein [Caudoviricetes sp.]
MRGKCLNCVKLGTLKRTEQQNKKKPAIVRVFLCDHKWINHFLVVI